MRRWTLLALLVVSLSSGGSAIAQEPLRMSGEATGELEEGEQVVVRLRVADDRGVGNIDRVRVELETNGSTVDRLEIDPAVLSISLEGGRTTSTQDDEPLRGAFISVVPSEVQMSLRGKVLELSIPIDFIATPAPGSELVASARSGLATAGPLTLGDPARRSTSFSITSLILAGAIALLSGAALGGAAAARRRSQTPHVYAAVRGQLRREQPERGEPAMPERGDESRAAAETATARATPKRPGAKKTAARKRAAAKPSAKKPAARKPSPKKSAAKKSAAKGVARKSTAKKPAAKRSSAR